MAKRIYIDTSIVGGYFDNEFEFWTSLFFESIKKGRHKIVISEILIKELELAPIHIRNFLNQIDNKYKEYVEMNLASEELANSYVNNGVVGIKSLTDCRHIAIATVNNVEILTSWNFKHRSDLNFYSEIKQGC